MTRPGIDSRWSLLSLHAPILENSRLRVVVLPEVGGRIWSIVDKRHDREMLWHNPRIPPRKLPFGAVYDDVWCGGWEEIFPNDAPGIIDGEQYPDHGESWAIEWDWSTRITDDASTLTLTCQTPISGIRIEKHLTLRGDEARLSVEYRLSNPNGTKFSFLFKLHAALAVAPGYRIEFPPQTTVEIEPAFLGTLAGAPLKFPWPEAKLADETIDMSEVPPADSRRLHFFYGTGYREGWCAVSDPFANLSYGATFDPDVFRSCWLFGSFGGWRNHRVAVLEPSTSYPFQVESAAARGNLRTLEPGESLVTQVVFSIQESARWQAG